MRLNLRRQDDIPMRMWRLLTVVMVAMIAAFASRGTAFADDGPTERPSFHTGRRLSEELNKPLNIVLNRTSPRAVVRQLQDLHHVALLLDRRIDPDRTIDIQLVQTTLREGLELLAVQLDADFAQIGGTLFIGPVESTDRMRTLIALRTAEVREIPGEDTVRRQFELLRGTTIHWEMLTEPDHLLRDIAQSFQLQMQGEPIPHDLWAQGAMADVNAPEALSLLLGQFDLTFTWEDEGNVMRVVPAPEHVTVEQALMPRSLTTAEAIAQIRQQWPHLEPRAEGRSVVVTATAGEHDAIAALLAPDREMEASAAPKGPPLSRRRFTLTARRAEARAIIRTLEAQEITISYDAADLRRSSVDLREKVSLELEQATVGELFEALCEPLGLTFTIVSDADCIVRLTPKAASREPADNDQ